MLGIRADATQRSAKIALRVDPFDLIWELLCAFRSAD
jgi:hypothetical protein